MDKKVFHIAREALFLVQRMSSQLCCIIIVVVTLNYFVEVVMIDRIKVGIGSTMCVGFFVLTIGSKLDFALLFSRI
jgi:hypothetical protein